MDPTNLIRLETGVLVDKLYNQDKENGGGPKSLGLKKIYLNRCPMLVEPRILDSQLFKRLGIDPKKNTSNANVVQEWRERNYMQFQDKCKAFFLEQKFKSISDPDGMLYSGGFFSDSDKRMMLKVRSTPSAELASTHFVFQDIRLPEMLKRYHARNYPETLSEKALFEWEEFRRKRIIDPDQGASISLAEFRKMLKIKMVSPDISDEQKTILEELRSYADILLN